jgi:Tol biopolymer transport system component
VAFIRKGKLYVIGANGKGLRRVGGRRSSFDADDVTWSPDGRFLAYTGGSSRIFVRDLRRGVTRKVSGGGEAWEPVISRGGRTVAFTTAHGIDVLGVYGGQISLPGATVSEPSISADGRFVAYTARGAGSESTAVYVHDVETGRSELVSKSTAGVPALGASERPSISADGTRVAFTSDAWNLSPDKCNPARGIFVRDLAAGTTTLVSHGDGANAGLGPTKGSGGASAMRVALMCA